MKLITSAEVCEILGISKSTLYRWNNLQDESYEKKTIGSILNKSTSRDINLYFLKNKNSKKTSLVDLMNNSDDEIPKDFPRPFKIGRLLKWDEEEIKIWLESKRLK
mgnify:CR=1 FL=1|jgi:hypothetical protein